MRPVAISELPEELASRVRAATGEPRHLFIHQRSDGGEGADQVYLAEAITGDRITIMVLASRADGSVAETTDSFLTSDVVEVVNEEGRVELRVESATGRRTVPVTGEMAQAVHGPSDDDDHDDDHGLPAAPPRPRPRHGLG